eukprot:gene1896-1928_t
MSSAVASVDAPTLEAAPKKGGKKKLLLRGLPLLLIAAGAGLWFGGVLPPLLGMGAHAEEHGGAHAEHAAGKPGELNPEADAKAKIPVFVDLPDLVANLNVGQRRSSFIKLKAKIEIARAEDRAAVSAAMPRLQDMFTTYLREMRPEELRGSAGTYRLREELLARANIARDDYSMSGAQAGGTEDGVAPTAMSDEELAASWGAGTDQDASPDLAAVQPARVLNQAEIDSLLGFDDGPTGGENRTGMQKIISSGLVSYERLPMLEIVFDRLVLFKAEEWDNYGLMVVDSAMIYSIVDVLLGGRRGTAAMRIEGRPYTTIERTLVERLIHVVLADLSASFDPLFPVTFRFERLEVNPRFATISRLSNAAVLARLRIDMEDRGGRMELMLPYATLEPVRELLLQQFMGEKFGRDSIWETHLAEELWSTDVDLEVVLDEVVMSLSQVIALKVGTQITLNTTQHAVVSLRFTFRSPSIADVMELVLNVILIIMLAATLFHAMRLERALGVLKRDRASLEEMVTAFNASTQLAEQSIDRLRNSADGAGRQISKQIDMAAVLSDDLQLLSERGEKVADRLDALVRAENNELDRTAVDGREGLMKNIGYEASDREDVRSRLRSKAERDLLKALKMGERALLVDLRQRRIALEAREATAIKREQTFQAVEKRLAARIEELTELQKRLEELERQRKERDEGSWRSLVKLYETMKPKDAATIFNDLDTSVLVPVLDRMKESKAAPIMSAMSPERARMIEFNNVEEASDGTEALAKLRSGQFGLVISDWNMQPMTGLELLQEVRADAKLKQTPFIMITAESKAENVVAAKQAGVSNYIVKPFNAETLKEKIEKVLAHSKKELDVEAVVRAVFSTLHGDLTGNETSLLAEVEDLGRTIAAAKAEIAKLRVDEITDSHIPSATDELDAIVAHTATATNSILEACEMLDAMSSKMSGVDAECMIDATSRIYEACSFQDITGQRICKVIAESRAIARDPKEASGLLNGPQLPMTAMAQSDIDRLLASFETGSELLKIQGSIFVCAILWCQPVFSAEPSVTLRYGDHLDYGRVVFDIEGAAALEPGRSYLRSIVNGHLVIDVFDAPPPAASIASKKPRVQAGLIKEPVLNVEKRALVSGPASDAPKLPLGLVEAGQRPKISDSDARTSDLQRSLPAPLPIAVDRTSTSMDLILRDGQPEPTATALAAVANEDAAALRPGHSTFVPLAATTGAAAFRRGNEAFVVFDERKPVDLKRLAGDPVFAGASIQLAAGATILRFSLPTSHELRLEHQKGGWMITVIGGDAIALALRPVSLERKGDLVVIQAEQPGLVVSVPDSITGGVLQVGTQRSPGQGIPVSRRSSEYILLPTWQGVVMEPLSDGVTLRATNGAFLVSGDQPDTALLVPNAAGSFGASLDSSHMSRIFDFPDLKSDALLQRLQGAVLAAAETPEPARGPARQAVAQTMIALGMAAEAKSVLELAGTEDARSESTSVGSALAGVASLLAGRLTEADQLDSSKLDGTDEISFWRAVKTAVRLRDNAAAANVFANTMPLLLSYPSELQQRLLPLAAETMALGGQLAAARRITEGRPTDESLDLARALLEQRGKDPRRAAEMYQKLGASPDRLVRFRAARASAEFQLSSGALDATHTADQLEKLLYAWRGDEGEIDLRLRIAELRGEAHQWRPALQLLRESAQLWPDRSEAFKSRLSEIFAASIAETARGGIKPFELVAMAEENVDLMPDGEAGQALAERVADALTELDLPERAIPYFVKMTAKAPQGVARASFGGRLAQMRLEQGDAPGALDVLQATVADSLPPALLEARTLTFGSAVAQIGDLPSAFNALKQLDTSAGDLRQADLAEQARSWPEAKEALSRVVSRDVPSSGKLTDAQCSLLLRLAGAASEAGDAMTLGQLRERNPSMLPPGKTSEMLQLILAQPLSSVGDLPRASRELLAARSVSP